MPLSPPYILRGFLLTLSAGLLLVNVPPLRAQPDIPLPSPSIVGDLSTAAETLGVVSVVAIIVSLVVLMAVGALFVGVYRLGKPLVDNIAIANRRADEAAKAERDAREEQQMESSTHLKLLDERERETQALRTRQAEAMESLGGSVVTLGGTMERIAVKMNDNDERSEEGRTRAVTQINAHVDEKFDELRKGIVEPMDKKLDVILTRLVPDEKPDKPADPDAAPPEPPEPPEPPAPPEPKE